MIAAFRLTYLINKVQVAELRFVAVIQVLPRAKNFHCFTLSERDLVFGLRRGDLAHLPDGDFSESPGVVGRGIQIATRVRGSGDCLTTI